MFSLAMTMILANDNVFMTGNKTMHKQLGMNAIGGLESAARRGLGQNAEISEEELSWPP